MIDSVSDAKSGTYKPDGREPPAAASATNGNSLRPHRLRIQKEIGDWGFEPYQFSWFNFDLQAF